MKRRRAGRPAALEDRDLAAEVTYLHSLWRRGPSKPAGSAAAAAVPNQSGAARRGPPGKKSKRRRTGPESPPASASAAPSSPEKPPSNPVAVAQEEAGTDRGASRSARRKGNKVKRNLRGAEETQQVAGSEKPLALQSPPAANKTWSDAPTSPTPSKPTPTPTPPSPGSLAHREALRLAEEFFATNRSDEDDDDEDDETSESEGDEEEATEFFTGLFERDAALRGHYERGWEDGQFACMACAVKKKKGKAPRKGKARRFRGCVSLVQHARAATRYGRPGAHRALTAVVCRVLGWDVQRLPSIVLDPRGTLSQELADRAQTDDAQEVKEDVGPEMNGSNTNGDELANELPTSKESAEMKDVEEIDSLDQEHSSANETNPQANYGAEARKLRASDFNYEKRSFDPQAIYMAGCGKAHERLVICDGVVDSKAVQPSRGCSTQSSSMGTSSCRVSRRDLELQFLRQTVKMRAAWIAQMRDIMEAMARAQGMRINLPPLPVPGDPSSAGQGSVTVIQTSSSSLPPLGVRRDGDDFGGGDGGDFIGHTGHTGE